MLDFWVSQLRDEQSWQARFAAWRSHPDASSYSHHEAAADEARVLAEAAEFAERARREQLAIIACLSTSECLENHDLAISLLEPLLDGDPDLAELEALLRARHEVIRQFQRFPARNRTLQRASTPTEAYFMLGAGQQYF